MTRGTAGPAALAGSCALAVVALWFAANDLAPGREFDAALADAAHTGFAGFNQELLKGASSLGDTLPIAVGSLALAALAWLRGGRRLALVVALALLAGNVATQLTQPALIEARHVDLTGTALEGSGSWPSGHAMAAMLLALLAILVAGPRLRVVTALVGLAYALGLGTALVALGGHLPSDVTAAYLVAATFTLAGAAVYAALRDDRESDGACARTRTRTRSPRVAPALGALAAAAVLATGIGKAVVTRRDEVARALDQVPLVLAGAAALTVAVLIGAGAVIVLRR